MTQLGKLLCTNCLNSLMDLEFCMIICTYFVMNLWCEDGECQFTKIYHYLQVLWLYHLKLLLYLSNNTLTGTLPTEMGNMNKLSKLLCTHCLNSLMDFAFCMIICTSMSWIYDLNMESINWPKYLTTFKSCNFLIPKIGCFCQITH